MEETEAKVRPGRRKKIVLVLIAAAALLGIGLFCIWFFTIRNTGPIPRKYTRGLDFALYYPTRLPKGYSVKANSFERKDNVLIFSIGAPDGRNLAVAQQVIPSDAPARSNSPKPIALPGEKSFQAAAGSANIGLWGDKYVADIITPKGTWIIINATHFTADEATAVAQAFTEL